MEELGKQNDVVDYFHIHKVIICKIPHSSFEGMPLL